MGHDVSVIYPLIPIESGAKWYSPGALIGRTLDVLNNLRRGVVVDWFNLKANLIRVPTLDERHIPDADIVVATWWATAWYVKKYSKNKGEKFYLIQHYEIWGGPKEKVEGTYKLGLRNIVISTWLRNILRDKMSAPIEALVPDAVDINNFYPEENKSGNESLRILMPYRSEKWKGIADGIKAFEIARQCHPNIQLVMFGPALGKDVPCYVEFHKYPYGERLRKIYNSCDIFLFPSHAEGFGLTPMEAMACNCAVVTTNVGGIPDYTIPGETALVSPPKSPELLARNLIRLIEDAQLREKIADAGYQYISRFTWDKVTKDLEDVFIKALNARG